jgi:hypothetical protein
VPTLEKVADLPEALGQVEPLLADTGHFRAANVRPTCGRPAGDGMTHRLTTKAGRALHGLRKQTVEPMFGIIERVMGWRQMSMRGLEKARGEGSLVTMARNVKRLHVLRAA